MTLATCRTLRSGAAEFGGIGVAGGVVPVYNKADEPTSRRADEPTSRRADEPNLRLPGMIAMA